MPRRVSVITYHYVRDLKNSRYPEIKGLGVEDFRRQLRYVVSHHQVISMEQLFAAIELREDIPQDAALLTFDDGYIDHFTYVFPILCEFKIKASFFAPVKAATEDRVLDFNKIHFILASLADKKRLVEEIFGMLDEYRSGYSLEPNSYYFNKFALPDRFDSGEIIFIKRMLQKGLPEELRRDMVGRLFDRYVTKDEAAFSKELYMKIDQLNCLRRNGMYVGGHGYDHSWLTSISTDSREKDVDITLKFLQGLGADTSKWAISYPYGGYDDSILQVLRKRGCVAGFTINMGVADIDKDDALALPRLDTNDLTKVEFNQKE